VKELKSIFGLLLLMIGGVVLYKTVPAYWGNFKVDHMIAEQAVYYTNFPKSDDAVAAAVSQKAQELGVFLVPEQVTVSRTSADLSISVAYAVHIDLPGYPFDLNFKNTTSNHNIMK
jgi:hypothetical protein